MLFSGAAVAGGARRAGVAIRLSADEGRRLKLRGQKRVAARAGEVDHVGRIGRGGDRHVRQVQRPRRGDDALAAPILAVPVERLVRGPALEDEIERLPQARVPVFVRQAALVREQRIGKSRAEAEDEAAAADHMIGDGGLDRGVDRVREMDELDRRAHADPLGQCRRLAHQQFGHRQGVDPVDIDRLAVMLADIGVTESELIGQHDLEQVLVVGLGGGGVRAKAVRENTEFH